MSHGGDMLGPLVELVDLVVSGERGVVRCRDKV